MHRPAPILGRNRGVAAADQARRVAVNVAMPVIVSSLLPNQWGCAARRRDEQNETVVARIGSFQMINTSIHPSPASHGRYVCGASSPETSVTAITLWDAH
jgi:hypothetical protein